MKKRNTMKEGNPNPKQECSDLAKSFLSFTKLNIFHKDLLTYLTGNIWQPNGLTKIVLKLSIGSHFPTLVAANHPSQARVVSHFKSQIHLEKTIALTTW